MPDPGDVSECYSSTFVERPESANVYRIPACCKDQCVPGTDLVVNAPPEKPSNDRHTGAHDVHLVDNRDIRRMATARTEAEHCAVQPGTTDQNGADHQGLYEGARRRSRSARIHAVS